MKQPGAPTVVTPSLFQRLQSELARMIAETPAGNRLPSEPELAQSLKVSRATLREAMRSFEAQGLIRRRQGIGTFVVSQPQVIESGLEVLESIETLSHRIQLDVSMGELDISSIQADAYQADALGVEVGSTLVRVSRVIIADNRPVAYLVDILPDDILTPEELRNGFNGSVLDFLIRRGSPPPATSLTEIRAAAASTDISRALQIQRGDVLLNFEARLYTLEARNIDLSYSYFLPGYFRFQVVRRVGELG